MQQHVLVLLFVFLANTAKAQQEQGANRDKREEGIFHTAIPAHPYDIILAQPTGKSVILSIMMNEDASGFVQYGDQVGKLDQQTTNTRFLSGKPLPVLLDKLQPGKQYFYRFQYKNDRTGREERSEIYSFFTQRKPGQSFSFCVQADSHLDENASPEMYLQTLDNMNAGKPDFLIDLGDTWMTDKYRTNYKDALSQYIAQRYYFDKVGRNAPVFFTLGNHDGEAGGQGKKNGTDGMLGWSTITRNTYYSNPAPDGFYSGNKNLEDGIGAPKNYYAWQWGDALFIVLDPFRYSKGNKNPWQRTIGAEQYQWLKQTLEQSKAAFKFVFIHNLVGGLDNKGRGRGGAEAAKYFEWGGLDTTGINQFAENRPGWEKPIHDLLVANHVTIVFHGHDHFFAKQDLEGIVYQLVPQPGSTQYGNTRTAVEYGYTQGKILNTPGYLRISVSEKTARIDYVQSSNDTRHKNGEVLYSYTVEPKRSN